MAGRTVNSATDGEARVPLPTDVREEDTKFTTIYNQGQMVYDGAAAREGGAPGAAVARLAAADGAPPSSLNDMLKWGIENSSKEGLDALAASGRKPTQV